MGFCEISGGDFAIETIMVQFHFHGLALEMELEPIFRSSAMDEQEAGGRPGRKVAVVMITVLCLGFVAYRAWSYFPGSVVRPAPTGGIGSPPPRDQILAIEKELGITADQRKQLEALRDQVGPPSPQTMGKMREGMIRILTLDQRLKMGAKMRSIAQQRVNQDKAKLSPDQAEKLQQKFDERMAQMQRDGFAISMPRGGGRP